MCRHNHIPILPKSIEGPDNQNYMIDRMLANISDGVFCTKCGRTGHYIKSYRGGIRWHSKDSTYFLNRGNNIRSTYGIPSLKPDNNEVR